MESVRSSAAIRPAVLKLPISGEGDLVDSAREWQADAAVKEPLDGRPDGKVADYAVGERSAAVTSRVHSALVFGVRRVH